MQAGPSDAVAAGSRFDISHAQGKLYRERYWNHAISMLWRKKVGSPQWVSSSDISPFRKFARELTRQYRLDKADAPEDFFKLCFDMGARLNDG